MCNQHVEFKTKKKLLRFCRLTRKKKLEDIRLILAEKKCNKKWMEGKEIDRMNQWTNQHQLEEKGEGKKWEAGNKWNAWKSIDWPLIFASAAAAAFSLWCCSHRYWHRCRRSVIAQLNNTRKFSIQRIVFHSCVSKWSVTKWFKSVSFDTHIKSLCVCRRNLISLALSCSFTSLLLTSVSQCQMYQINGRTSTFCSHTPKWWKINWISVAIFDFIKSFLPFSALCQFTFAVCVVLRSSLTD